LPGHGRGPRRQPYGGFADDIPIVEGHTTLPEDPGIGMELKSKMMDQMLTRLELV
jgi:hypothetical protein